MGDVRRTCSRVICWSGFRWNGRASTRLHSGRRKRNELSCAVPAAVQDSMTVTKLDELKAFILDAQRMGMSHIYKPLMIIAVLRNGGAASRDQIAAEFVSRDLFQVEHSRRRVIDKMPGLRLVRDGVLERNGDIYSMAEVFRGLRKSKQMDYALAKWLTHQGDSPWHRFLTPGRKGEGGGHGSSVGTSG
jgi:hypothetical protein